MKGSKFSEEKIVSILQEADRFPVTQVARAHDISNQTIYNWRRCFCGMTVDEVIRLKQLEKENASVKGRRFNEEKIVTILREANNLPVIQVARAHGISEQTIYNWRKRFGGMTVDEVKQLKLLEEENARLKKLLAEKELSIAALKETNAET